MDAALHAADETIHLLLCKGSDPDATDSQGYSALVAAIISRSTSTIAILAPLTKTAVEKAFRGLAEHQLEQGVFNIDNTYQYKLIYRQFCEISISIKYHINKNLAYRTPLAGAHPSHCCSGWPGSGQTCQPGMCLRSFLFTGLQHYSRPGLCYGSWPLADGEDFDKWMAQRLLRPRRSS